MNLKLTFIALLVLFILSLIFKDQIQNIKFWFAARKLKRALHKKNVKRRLLKYEILQDLRKYLKLNGISEYIPYDHKSREKMKDHVHGHYGDKLAKLDVSFKITRNKGIQFS